MPRTTRAAHRLKELAEEEAIAASVPLPTTPQKERVPLGEIADNKGAESTMVDNIGNKPIKPAPKKGRKTKGAKKANSKRNKNETEESGIEVEVLEDGNQSSTSSAAEEACEELKNRQDPQTLVMTDNGPQAPSSPAADMASKEMDLKPTPQFDPEVHQPDAIERTEAKGPEIFDTKPVTCVPQKQTTEQIDETREEAAKEDSFIEQIKSRSPAKRISRIEDSVEALDKLEEEIEKVGQAITPQPTAGGLPTPPKENTTAKATHSEKNLSKASGKEVSKANGKAVEGANASKNGVTTGSSGSNKPGKRPSARPGATDIKPKENRASLLRQGIKPSPTKRISSVTKAPAATARHVGAAPQPSAGPAKQVTKPAAPPAKRVSSVTKPPFQPAKSSKSVTRSSFELPGEAISRKLKEQREQRLKQEEEEKLKKQAFKARPVRLSHAPEVRMTTATRARLSMAKQPSTETSRNSTQRPSPLTSSVSSLGTSKRTSSLTITKRSSPPASSTVQRAPSRSSVPGEPRGAPTAENLAHQKIKGKEAFARPKNEIAAREKERKEKEEAAKRARIEAAERGRVASREWAEKQKAKKMAAMAAKEATTA